MIYCANDIGSKELAPLLRARTNIPVEVIEMDAADFAFEGQGPNGRVLVGMERKTISDMLSSMRSGRYAGFQMVKMGRDYDVCYLIVEGLWRPSEEGLLEIPVRRTGRTRWVPYRLSLATKNKSKLHAQSYMYSELDKHLCTVEMKKNVIYLRSTSRGETAWQVVNRAAWWAKPWDSHHSADPIKTQADVALQFASACKQFASILPGIGWKRAQAVAACFGSIEEAVNAEVVDWKRVDGIGPNLAAKLHAWVRK